MPDIDLLVTGGDIVTMNPDREVLMSGAVAIAGDTIVAVGSTSRLRAQYPGARELDATDCVVTPGIVSAHQHFTGDPLVRSVIPDTITSGPAVFDWSVPLHAVHTGDDDEISALLTATESLLKGVTTLVEAGTVAHPDRVGAGMHTAGVRGTVGCWGWDAPGVPFGGTADEVVDRQRAMLDAFPPGERVSAMVTLVGHSLASDDLLVAASDLAKARAVGMTMHMSPSPSDTEAYLASTGRPPIVHLDDLGVLGAHLLLAHCVYIDDAEFEALLRTRTAVGYCPWSYFRVGSGVTGHGRHGEFFTRGGRIGLGCDAINAGDQVSVLRAASLAAGIAKDVSVDPSWFGAHEALEMATIRGADAIGMAADIGSLEVGKKADIVIHDATEPQWVPRGDVVLQLIWSAEGETVRDVFVDGVQVVAGGKCLTVDMDALRSDANALGRDLLARAGLEVPHRWPQIPAG